MLRSRLLLLAAVVTWARLACCCWAAAPGDFAGASSGVVRLPDVAVADSDPSLAFTAEPEAASEVVPTDYEELFVEEEDRGTPVVNLRPNATRLFESTWYARVDYFQWTETIHGEKFMENTGAMPTLGYQRRHGRQRVRAELFGSRVDYFADLGGLDDSNVTDYLGLRGEYEVMYEPDTLPRTSLFAGIGTRFFVRSIPDITIGSVLVDGYQESWWTFYPYLGAETRRTLKPEWEFFYRWHLGLTAFTREHIASNDVTLFPRAGAVVMSELGFRGPRWHISFYTEVMAWSPSRRVLAYDAPFVYQVNQPESINTMLGLKTGFSY